MPATIKTFIYPSDLLKFYTHIKSYNGAWARYDSIKKCLGKKKHQRLTVEDFAAWEDLPPDIIRQTIS